MGSILRVRVDTSDVLATGTDMPCDIMPVGRQAFGVIERARAVPTAQAILRMDRESPKQAEVLGTTALREKDDAHREHMVRSCGHSNLNFTS